MDFISHCASQLLQSQRTRVLVVQFLQPNNDMIVRGRRPRSFLDKSCPRILEFIIVENTFWTSFHVDIETLVQQFTNSSWCDYAWSLVIGAPSARPEVIDSRALRCSIGLVSDRYSG